MPQQKKQIEHDEKGIVQNAADALQKALMNGLVKNGLRPIKVINLPFISSYPQAYRRWFLPAVSGILLDNVQVLGCGFINIRFARIYARLFAAYSGLRRAIEGENCLIFVYSAHLPFILAALACKLNKNGIRICLILPDLPEFVGDVGMYRHIVLNLEKLVFRLCLRRIDYFVLVARAMAERLNIPPERFVVVEGIFDQDQLLPTDKSDRTCSTERVFLYTGTLAMRYGIVDLLDAFRSLSQEGVRLIICGEGDAKDVVVAASAEDHRIEYLGQLGRAEALALQRNADVLVNPRRPDGEYTKYSFPSKTLEYLASGRPVVMHNLPSLPQEYLDFIICPETPDAAGMAKALRDCIALPLSTLDEIGRRGQEHVLTKKTPAAQCMKIATLVSEFSKAS